MRPGAAVAERQLQSASNGYSRPHGQSEIVQNLIGPPPAAYLFPSRQSASSRLSTRQYARLVKQWMALMGGDPADYGTHSLRRTKTTLICRKTKNLPAVQLLLGHRKIEYTVRYLGIEVDDALEMAEHIEC
jgi:site-specific recombinase XerD